MCEYIRPGMPSPFSENSTIVIEKDTVSDLLISGFGGTVRAFILNDNSFVIPEQIIATLLHYHIQSAFSGNGIIRSDSICLSYISGHRVAIPPYSDMGIYSCDNCKAGSSNAISLSTTKQKQIYYNAEKQEIVIEESLQNQSLTLELYDILGKMLSSIVDANTVSIIHLPNGVYVYRLLENNKVISSGKIVK